MTTPAMIKDAVKAVNQAVKAVADASDALAALSLALAESTSTKAPAVDIAKPDETTEMIESPQGGVITIGNLKAFLDMRPDAAVRVVIRSGGRTVATNPPIAVAEAAMRFEPSGDRRRPARPYFDRGSHRWIGIAPTAPIAESTMALCIGASVGSSLMAPTASELSKTLAAHLTDHCDMAVEVGVWVAEGPRTGALIKAVLNVCGDKSEFLLTAEDGAFPWPEADVDAANAPQVTRTIDAAVAVASAMASMPAFTDEHIAKAVQPLVPASWTLRLCRTGDAMVPIYESNATLDRDFLLDCTPSQEIVASSCVERMTAFCNGSDGTLTGQTPDQQRDGRVYVYRREPVVVVADVDTADTAADDVEVDDVDKRLMRILSNKTEKFICH